METGLHLLIMVQVSWQFWKNQEEKVIFLTKSLSSEILFRTKSKYTLTQVDACVLSSLLTKINSKYLSKLSTHLKPLTSWKSQAIFSILMLKKKSQLLSQWTWSISRKVIFSILIARSILRCSLVFAVQLFLFPTTTKQLKTLSKVPCLSKLWD